MTSPAHFVFAGSSVGEPWWTVGEVTARVLAPLGYEVEVEARSASTENPRWVGRGDALIGCAVPSTVQWATEGKYQYEGESFPEFRAIARLERPSWLAVAATVESRITSLAQVKEQRLPVRLLTGNWDSVATVVPKRVLAYYGLSREEIESWGGRFHRITGHPYSPFIRENDVDLIIGNIYLGYSPVGRYWQEASILLNLRFLDLPEDLIEHICRERNGERGFIPRRLVRGVDRDVPSVASSQLLVYGRADLPEEFTYQLARAYDEQSFAFLETAIHMAYDSRTAFKTPIPLHPGAERYYREKGYL